MLLTDFKTSTLSFNRPKNRVNKNSCNNMRHNNES